MSLSIKQQSAVVPVSEKLSLQIVQGWDHLKSDSAWPSGCELISLPIPVATGREKRQSSIFQSYRAENPVVPASCQDWTNKVAIKQTAGCLLGRICCNLRGCMKAKSASGAVK